MPLNNKDEQQYTHYNIYAIASMVFPLNMPIL